MRVANPVVSTHVKYWIRALRNGKPLKKEIDADTLAQIIVVWDAFESAQLKTETITQAHWSSKYRIRLEDVTIHGNLDLHEARSSSGRALPPVEFSHCTFDETILLSRSHFEQLSFRGSRFRWLRANGIKVDGTLDLSLVASLGEDRPTVEFQGIPSSPVTMRHEDSSDFHCPRVPKRPKDAEPLRAIEPLEPVIEVCNFAEDEGDPFPLCWVELRNAQIGIDVDAGGAHLACPAERRGSDLSDGGSGKNIRRYRYFNSPHAWYALDLRGAKIEGRLNISQDDRYDADKLQSERKINPDVFRAIGGVSVVRCQIGGSVCASGATLIALEGNAFSAERTVIGGRLMLDYAWEGRDEIELFRAWGFIDLTGARIGSSINMHCAELRSDHHSRAGLFASGLTVGGNCILNSFYPSFAPIPRGRRRESLGFYSEGGVALRGATIRGTLNLTGAHLCANSYGTALFAVGMTVEGGAQMKAQWCDSKEASNTPYFRPFQTDGLILMSGATIGRDLEFRGAILRSPKDCELPYVVHPHQEHASLVAEQVQIKGSFQFLPLEQKNSDNYVRSESKGGMWLARSVVGANFDMRGARLSTAGNGPVLDLTCLRIAGDAALSAKWIKDENISSVDDGTVTIGAEGAFTHIASSGATKKGQCFESTGQLWLRSVRISGLLYMGGARLDAPKKPLRDGRMGIVLDAVGLHVSGYAHLGLFDKHSTLPLTASGGFELTSTVFSAGLSMRGVEITCHVVEEFSAQSQAARFVRRPALRAKMATIRMLDLSNAKFVGSLRLRGLQCERGVDATKMRVLHGCIDLWDSRVGYLEMSDLSLYGIPPSDTDKLAKDHVVSEMLFKAFPKEGNVPECVDGPHMAAGLALERIANESPDAPALSPRRESSVDVIDFGQMKVAGKLTFSRELEKKITFRLENSNRREPEEDINCSEPAENSDQPVWVPVPCYIDLRECVVDSLDDDNGAGWGLDMPLKLQGFVCRRAPLRIPDKTTFGNCERDLHTGFFVPFSSMRRAWRKLLGLRPELRSDAHIAFLNRQYASPKKAKLGEFAPSAYDQLASVLREDGQDKLANTVLSSKLAMRRRVEYGVSRYRRLSWFLSFRPLQRFALWAFDFGFDHGLSTTRCLVMFAVTLSLGAGLVSVERGLFVYPTLFSESGKLTFRPRLNSHFLATNHMETAPGRLTLFSDPSGKKISVLQVPEGDGVEEVPCDPNRINAFLYAADTMVPALDLGQEQLCEVKPKAWRWRYLQASFTALGWLVTSITLLTVPGFLRKRAEREG